MPFIVEDAVPIPAAERITKGTTKYPFAEMAVGQSFAVPFDAAEKDKVEGRLRGAVQRYSKAELGTVKFTVRVMDNVVRVWRVA